MKKFLFVLVVFFCWGQKAWSQPQEIIVYFQGLSDAQVDAIRVSQFNAIELERSLPSDCRLWKVTFPVLLQNGTYTYNIEDVLAQGNGNNASQGVSTKGGGGNNPLAMQLGQGNSSPYSSARGIPQYNDMPYILNCSGETNGSNIRIALIDSGVNMGHEYFLSMMGQQFPLSSDFFVDPYSFVTNSSAVDDDLGHGTHIAGLIAEQVIGYDNGNNHIQLMPIQIINGQTGYASTWSMIKAIDYAVNHDANVINLSLSYYDNSNAYLSTTDSPLEHTIATAMGKEILVVCSAGNGNSSNINDVFPAGFLNHKDDLIVVGSLHQDVHTHLPLMSSFSNYGPTVDVFAPGENLVYPTQMISQYNLLEGTSMAAGWVSGALAGMLSKGYSYQDMLQIINACPKDLLDPDNRFRPVFDLSLLCQKSEQYLPLVPDWWLSPRLSNNSISVKVLPNPTTDKVSFELQLNEDTSIVWDLYSPDGKKIIQGVESALKGNFSKEIQLPEVMGVYRLVVNQNGVLSTIPIIKIQ